MASHDPRIARILEDAALLQQKVPDTVLVGGTVAAYYANHRLSFDHDHVLADLELRFDTILQALEYDPEYIINQAIPGKIILGEHNRIEYGIRQMIRQRPLEVIEETLPSGMTLRVPTVEEALRIKAYLLIKRNTTRDFLDVAALAFHIGVEAAAEVLVHLDDYYSDPVQESDAVASQLVRVLLEPNPGDPDRAERLFEVQKLDPKWRDWKNVTEFLYLLANNMRGDS